MSDAVYDAFVGSGNNIRQIVRTNYTSGATVIAARMSGAILPSQLFGAQAAPSVEFETADLLSALTAFPVSTGLALSSDSITIPWNRRANGGTFESTLSHFTLSATDGIAFLTDIAGSQDNAAVLASGIFLPTSSDGFTDPITEAKNQTLTAQAFVGQYDFGPVYVDIGSGAAEVPQAVNWRVSTGLSVRSRRFSGGVYPRYHFVVEANPAISIGFEDTDQVADVFGTNWAALTSAAVYARKRTDGGTHLADSGSNHIKFSFAAGISNLETVSGAEGGSAGVSVVMFGKALTVATTSAIP